MQRIRFDEKRCTGCHTCDIACLDRMDIKEPRIHLRAVKTTEHGTFPDVWVETCSTGCVHCAEPACLDACAVQAIVKDVETGFVLVEKDKCTGCGKCAEACRINAVFVVKGRAVKCDGCAELVKKGLEPVCVDACPMRALSFG